MDIVTLLITIICLVIFAILIYISPAIDKWVKSKHVPLNSIINNADDFTKIAADIAKKMSPQNAVMIDTLSDIANKAVRYAEQLYKSSQCKAEERKEKAMEFVKMALKDANITVDTEKEKYISAIIESAVYVLPKN